MSRGHAVIPITTFQPSWIQIWFMPFIAYSDAVKMAAADQIQAIIFQQSQVGIPAEAYVHTTYGKDYRFYIPGSVLPEQFLRPGTSIRIAPVWRLGMVLGTLFQLLLITFLAVLIYTALASRRNPFRKRRFRPIMGEVVTFRDVAGQEEAKNRLSETVAFLRNPAALNAMGGRPPRGVLLIGAPGNGKTLLARAVAGEAKVPFFHVAGSEMIDRFVGQGARNIRHLFKAARKASPCIVFVDEIEVIGGVRGGAGRQTDGQAERDQTQNQFLVEMDGFDPLKGVIVIAATNRPDMLDPAFTRPGRFDRKVDVAAPSLTDRIAILNVTSRKAPMADDVDLPRLARLCAGFSGADMTNVVNEAAIAATVDKRTEITMEYLVAARDTVAMGAVRAGLLLDDDERRVVAIHEAGHAITARHVEDSDPIDRATILYRGRALGHVLRLPHRERQMISLQRLESHLVVAMGGRQAERLIMGERAITSGAEADIKAATTIARSLVARYGMNARVGPVLLEPDDGDLPGVWPPPEAASLVAQEVRTVADAAADRAMHILKTHKAELEALIAALLEHETLTGEEIEQLLNTLPKQARIEVVKAGDSAA